MSDRIEIGLVKAVREDGWLDIEVTLEGKTYHYVADPKLFGIKPEALVGVPIAIDQKLIPDFLKLFEDPQENTVSVSFGPISWPNATESNP